MESAGDFFAAVWASIRLARCRAQARPAGAGADDQDVGFKLFAFDRHIENPNSRDWRLALKIRTRGRRAGDILDRREAARCVVAATLLLALTQEASPVATRTSAEQSYSTRRMRALRGTRNHPIFSAAFEACWMRMALPSRSPNHRHWIRRWRLALVLAPPAQRRPRWALSLRRPVSQWAHWQRNWNLAAVRGR